MMQTIQTIVATVSKPFIVTLLLCIILSGCTAIGTIDKSISTPTLPQTVCPVTKPEWVKPPEDSAVEGTPDYGYYYVNEDRSIWASAWWTGQEEEYLRANEEGLKVGWFRPAGATLEIEGQRIDAQAPPLDAHAPCCYPTRFQATGLVFPTEGCWQVNARATNSELSFIIQVNR